MKMRNNIRILTATILRENYGGSNNFLDLSTSDDKAVVTDENDLSELSANGVIEQREAALL